MLSIIETALAFAEAQDGLYEAIAAREEAARQRELQARRNTAQGRWATTARGGAQHSGGGPLPPPPFSDAFTRQVDVRAGCWAWATRPLLPARPFTCASPAPPAPKMPQGMRASFHEQLDLFHATVSRHPSPRLAFLAARLDFNGFHQTRRGGADAIAWTGGLGDGGAGSPLN